MKTVIKVEVKFKDGRTHEQLLMRSELYLASEWLKDGAIVTMQFIEITKDQFNREFK